jgi:hypothetical protein
MADSLLYGFNNSYDLLHTHGICMGGQGIEDKVSIAGNLVLRDAGIRWLSRLSGIPLKRSAATLS